MSQSLNVDGVAASLVREYLSRKGLKNTLHIMDEEMPRNSNSISNRQALVQELHIEKLMKKNKDKENPFRSMLEVMTEYHVQKTNKEPASLSYYPQTNVPSPDNVSLIQSKPRHESNFVPNNFPSSPLHRPKTAGYVSTKSSMSKTNTDLVIEDNVDGETILGDGKASFLNSDIISKPRQNRPVSSKPRGLSGVVMSNTEENSRRRVPKTPSMTSAISAINSESSHGNGSNLQGRFYPHLDSEMEISRDGRSSKLGLNNSPLLLGESLQISKITPQKHPISISDILENAEAKSNGLSKKYDSDEIERRYSVESSSMAADRPTSRGSSRKHASDHSAKTTTIIGDIEFGDIDDLENDINNLELQPVQVQTPIRNIKYPSQPIDAKTAIGLRHLLFSSALNSFNDEWRNQSLCFCDIPNLQYGIVQKKGGPCGVLAAIQASMLQEMLFSDNKIPYNRCLNPSREERSRYLAAALSKILWRAGGKSKATIVLPSGKSHVISSAKYKPDNLTETLMLYSFTNSDDLLIFLKQYISQFENDGNSGVILILYSAILSRGIEKVKNDFDEAGLKLMAQHGYCTQEMVNLLLNGNAVSNVFNDVMELESGGVITVLKGITSRSDIGFLSLFEHYKSCQVGTFYKTPKYPIWVVCSESHFSVLFATKRELVNDWKAERHFDLYYYDGLARQQEEIKLTIDTSNRSFKAPSDNDLVPPLDHCIRTKWADAEVDWNGYEPIL